MNNIKPIEHHPWEPFIPSDATVLFLGTFPPKSEKWSMEFYYPNRINDFWRIMGIVFYNNLNYFYDIQSKSFRLNDIKCFLNKYGIALGDSAIEIRRLKNNASDKFLEIIKPLPLHNVINKMPKCKAIVSTGEKAAQIVASLTNTDIPAIGSSVCTTLTDNRQIRIFRMPSTSRAYPLAIEKKAQHYHNMFKSIGILF